MEIKRDALMRVIRAEREASALAELLRKMTRGGNSETKADTISDLLQVALSSMCGETFTGPDADFNDDSEVVKILTSALDNEAAAAEIEKIWMRNCGQPKPHTMDREAFKKSVMQNGGYMYKKPEGDWK